MVHIRAITNTIILFPISMLAAESVRNAKYPIERGRETYKTCHHMCESYCQYVTKLYVLERNKVTIISSQITTH